MSDSVSWSSQLKVKGRMEEVRAFIQEMVESTRMEPGTLGYEWYLDEEAKVCHVWEEYADPKATLTHLAHFNEKFGGRFDHFFDGRSFVVYGDPGAEVRRAIEKLKPVYLLPLGGFTR